MMAYFWRCEICDRLWSFDDDEEARCTCDGSVERRYNLERLRVLHYEHPLQSNPGDASAAVTLGFGWAETGEGQGMLLCRDRGSCKAPEDCGRTLWVDRDTVGEGGHEVVVQLPWAEDSSGVLASMAVWCCENCTVEGSGAVFDVWVGRFYDLPARLLAYLHERRAHTYTGLRTSMGKQYPDDFSETSFVTLVLYRRTL